MILIVLTMSTPPMRTALDVMNGYAAQWLMRIDAQYGENTAVITPEIGAEIAPDDLALLLQRLEAARPARIVVVPSGDRLMQPGVLAGTADLSVPFLQIVPDTHPLALDPPRDAPALATRPAEAQPFGYYRADGPGQRPERALPPFETVLFGPLPDAFWIGYLPDTEAPAVFDWDIVVSGQVPTRFFTDKIVVIATDNADYAEPDYLRTALLPQPVPGATFVAQSLQAIQDGRVLVAPLWRSSMLILAIASFVAGLTLVLLRDRAHPLHYAAATGSILAVTVLLATQFGIMFPLAEAIVAFTLAWWVHRFILDSNRRRRLRRQLIRVELLTASTADTERQTDTRWQASVSETAEVLGLRRHAFVQRKGLGTLIELTGQGDLLPRLTRPQRRTIQQALRSRADAGTILLPLPAADQAAASDSEEEAWLVTAMGPTGTRMGWIVFCGRDVISASAPRRAMIVAATERLAGLYPAPPQLDVSQTLDERIADRVRRLSKEAATLDALSHSTASAFAVFDLIGVFLRQNDRMRDIAVEGGLDISTLSLLDFVERTTGLSETQITELLFQMLDDGEPRRLPAATLSARLSFVLRLSIDPGRSGGSDGEAMGPVVLAELIDVTENLRLEEARRSVAQFFDQQLRNDFEAIDLVSEMLDDPELDDGMRLGLLKRLKDVTRRTTERMATFDVALGEMTGKLATQTVPQELRRALDELNDVMIAEGRRKGLTIDYDRPVLLSLVLAGAAGLPDALRGLGRLCLADAPADSIVRLSVEEQTGAIVTTIRSEGHGLPEEVVRQILDGSGSRLPTQLREVADTVRTVQSWGGRIGIETALDQGLTCTLTLERVV